MEKIIENAEYLMVGEESIQEESLVLKKPCVILEDKEIDW